ncbi:17706_t:CDS:10 [Cetraspora pellucida]|uniref:17706_t:CDS:1 n=1 Tax=Cetraspora pellucida TaxID=1433469 RepID=A0ACA9KLC2_9GLOM|nr:17706_t:CDS:10 [Cetraspora pellucida]
MSLSSKTKKCLYESLQQQYLNQKSAEYNEAKRFFIGLTDLNYKPGHRNHMYYKYLLASRPEEVILKGHGHTDKNDTALLDVYRPEEISDEYIIRVAEQGFTVVDHPFQVYGLPDAHEYIDGNLALCLVLDIDMRQKLDPINPELPFLDRSKISHEDLLSRILIVCTDIVYLDLKHLITLNAFVLASLSNAKEKLTKEEFKPIEDNNALVKGANLNAPICDVKHEKDQLYEFIHQNRCFILKYYRQKQYKPEHKGLSFDKVVKHLHLLIELSRNNINVKKMKNAPEAYSDFISEEPTTTLIRLPVASEKTKTLREILNSLAKSEANLLFFNWVSYCKTLSNKTKSKIEVLQKSELCIKSTHHLNFYKDYSHIVILDETNGIMHQIASGIHAQESENAMQDLLKSAIHVVAMDAFANELTLAFLRQYWSLEAIHKGFEMLKETSPELIAIENTKLAKAFHTEVFNTIKKTEERIKSSDAELIVNAPDINSNEDEMLKLNFELGFSDMDNINILSGDYVAKAFKQSQEKIVKIREDALLLFGFKTRAKGMPDLNNTIKFINTILSNWCGYTVKTDNRAGFETQERIKTIKLNGSNYHSIIPILLSYKPESIDETQKLFNSILITTDITISKSTLIKNQSNNSEQFSSITKAKKKLPKSLISLSSEYYIKNKSDINSKGSKLSQYLDLIICICNEFLVNHDGYCQLAAIMLNIERKYKIGEHLQEITRIINNIIPVHMVQISSITSNSAYRSLKNLLHVLIPKLAYSNSPVVQIGNVIYIKLSEDGWQAGKYNNYIMFTACILNKHNAVLSLSNQHCIFLYTKTE